MILYRQANLPTGRKSAIALGCFDGLHLGHAAVIHKAASTTDLGYIPAVFTFQGNTTKSLNGKAAPEIMTFSDKARTLWSWGIDGLFLESFQRIRSMSPESFVRDVLCDKYNAGMLFCGLNYRFGVDASGGAEELQEIGEKYGLAVHICDTVCSNGRPISSTWIRELILDGDVKSAQQLLGRPFRYDFPVVHGSQIGRKMGTPTLNQLFTYDFVLPKFGVYASSVILDGVRYHSVTNIGIRPTFHKETPLSETWIPGFSGDLYGRDVEVSLHEYLRPEKNFPSLDALRDAIVEDGKIAEKILCEYDKKHMPAN